MGRDSDEVLKILIAVTLILALLSLTLPKGVRERTTSFYILPPFKTKLKVGECASVVIRVDNHWAPSNFTVVAYFGGRKVFERNFSLGKGRSATFRIEFRAESRGMKPLLIYLLRDGKVYRFLRLWINVS